MHNCALKTLRTLPGSPAHLAVGVRVQCHDQYAWFMSGTNCNAFGSEPSCSRTDCVWSLALERGLCFFTPILSLFSCGSKTQIQRLTQWLMRVSKETHISSHFHKYGWSSTVASWCPRRPSRVVGARHVYLRDVHTVAMCHCQLCTGNLWILIKFIPARCCAILNFMVWEIEINVGHTTSCSHCRNEMKLSAESNAHLVRFTSTTRTIRMLHKQKKEKGKEYAALTH